MEISQERIQKFWEWSGLHFKLDRGGTVWTYNYHGDFLFFGYPDLTSMEALGLLFEYAVPKAIDKIMAKDGYSSDLAYTILFKKWLQELELIIPHADTALFLAIEKVMECFIS